MITTKRVFGLAAVILAMGLGTVEMTRDSAQAAEATTMFRIQAYSAARVDTASITVCPPGKRAVHGADGAEGDLRSRRTASACRALQAECMDVAYELPAEPSIVIETHEGTTTTLMRMDAMTIAKVNKDIAVTE
jgi:hypothetical protein